MKHLLLLLAWVSACSCFAQRPDTAARRIEHLPATGLLLAKGWRYHAGDNPAWARPDFDDSAWDTLNPARPRRELPPALNTGISWLRLRLRPGDSLCQHQLLLRSNQILEACEIYLNGRLVQRLGVLQANPTRVQPVGSAHPDPIEVPGATDLVLAVRYAPWHSPLAEMADQQPFFQLFLLKGSQVRQAAAEQAASNLFFT
ncbi:MAG: hypothetical protein ACRYFX_26875 [Janthinobacterium lividum]